MRNLWIFISKYNAFFLFVIFEIGALTIFVKNNSFQRASFINSANEFVGNVYSRVSEFTAFLNLGRVNDSLAHENAQLQNQLKSSFYVDSAAEKTVRDTVYKQQYTYLEARVINNSVNRRNNYLTINRGSKDGIAKGMGVISKSGVVGLIINTSGHLSTVQSLLHKDSRLSAMLADSKAYGSLIWANNLDPTRALLEDIPNHEKPRVGQSVVTSGYSLFPAGIPYGKVSKLNVKGSSNLLNIEVRLAVDFHRLQYVYVINNKLQLEQNQLEGQQKKDE
ncbi:MAG: rod shape-determining protein MreC [Sphingobacteriaceae bacterium]